MDEKIKQFAEKIKGAKSTYLAGGIQNRKNPNKWRLDLTEFFGKNNMRVINPVADNQEIFAPSVMGYKEDGKPYTVEDLRISDPDKLAILYKQTEENDLHFMQIVDFHVFYLDDSIGFGTNTEFRENFDNFKKPVIIVRTIPDEKLGHWNWWRRHETLKSGNAIEFKGFTEMKEFFKEYLGFKK